MTTPLHERAQEYLRLTAESYPHIAARLQAEYGGIVPPLTGGPSDGD